MSDHRTPLSRHANGATIDGNAPHAAGQQSLRCQWCSVPLATGVTICPTCGSPGIPDPRLTAPGLTDTIEPTPAQNPDTGTRADATSANTTGNPPLLWPEDISPSEVAEAPLNSIDFDAVERRRMLSMLFIGGGVLFCALLGWLIGPTLLQGPFESLTGSPVENPDDLRTMGTISGLMIGMCIGATAGWVVWSAT